MNNTATAPWDLSISASDFEKLKAGLMPDDMNVRWRITSYAVADANPDNISSKDNGKISVIFRRSWTGAPHYILDILPPDKDSGRAKVVAITWDQDVGAYISEEQGKNQAVLISRSMLNCEIEELPHYGNDVF